ncbi:MAG: hypothetical protein AB9M60_19665, partial [Leptothrix sp. (in: b-proteobacteria)]
ICLDLKNWRIKPDFAFPHYSYLGRTNCYSSGGSYNGMACLGRCVIPADGACEHCRRPLKADRREKNTQQGYRRSALVPITATSRTSETNAGGH